MRISRGCLCAQIAAFSSLSVHGDLVMAGNEAHGTTVLTLAKGTNPWM